MRFFSRLYAWHIVAPLDSASFTRPSIKLALVSLMTGVMDALSCTHGRTASMTWTKCTQPFKEAPGGDWTTEEKEEKEAHIHRQT